jgi:hypothetical protein
LSSSQVAADGFECHEQYFPQNPAAVEELTTRVIHLQSTITSPAQVYLYLDGSAVMSALLSCKLACPKLTKLQFSRKWLISINPYGSPEMGGTYTSQQMVRCCLLLSLNCFKIGMQAAASSGSCVWFQWTFKSMPHQPSSL